MRLTKALLATMPARTRFTKNEREIIVRTAQQKRTHCFAKQYERLSLLSCRVKRKTLGRLGR